MKSRLFLTAICLFFLTTSMSFAYTATFLPRLSVQGQYSDNILLTQNNDLKEDDFITTITPRLSGELIGKKGEANISYDPSYVFYNRFNEFNGWRHQAKLSGMYMLAKKTRLNFGDGFLYTEDPVRYVNIAEIRTEEPTTPIDTTERKTRRIYTKNYASVGLDHQFGKYHSFRLGCTHGFLSNDDPVYEDKQSLNPSVGLTYWFGPKWGFEVNGYYTRGLFEVSDNVNIYEGNVSLLKRFGKHFLGYIRYAQSVVNYEGPSENSVTYVPSLGFKYDIEKDISLTIDVGYFYTSYEFGNSDSSPNGDLRLVKQFERGKLNLAILGGYDYSLFGTENLGYTKFYEPSISGTYQLTKHVSGRIYGSYRYSKYTERSDRTDKSSTVGLGVTWQVLQRMSIGLNYRFLSVDSTVDTENYNENRVYISVTVSPKVPFHTSRY